MWCTRATAKSRTRGATNWSRCRWSTGCKGPSKEACAIIQERSQRVTSWQRKQSFLSANSRESGSKQLPKETARLVAASYSEKARSITNLTSLLTAITRESKRSSNWIHLMCTLSLDTLRKTWWSSTKISSIRIQVSKTIVTKIMQGWTKRL